jgi:hypothetical protein
VSRRTLSTAAAVIGALVLTVVALTTSGQAKPHPPYRVAIQASATTVSAGEQVTFTGKVRPVTKAMRKQNVKLQVTYPDGLFETEGLDRPDRQGRYAFTESFGVPGTYLVRARIAAGQGHSEGISQELTITVRPLGGTPLSVG